ncbi:MAG: phosphatase PAP2 family protein [Ardenticatenaceae bacterium]|nr:phosphatase PAP2 family protein [Ardenticatenaceae bacterium]
MEILWDRGIEIITWLQTNFPGLEGVMSVISELGIFEVYMGIVLWLYWCFDKVRGRRMAYLLAITNVGVNSLKHIFRGPRPYWFLVGDGFEGTSGYGVPSGHVTSATVAYTYLGAVYRNRFFRIFCVTWILLMGISRMYIDEHFPHDVLAGYLLAATIIGAYVFWNRSLYEDFKRRILGQRFWAALVIPAIVYVIYWVVLYFLPVPEYLAEFGLFAESAELASWDDVVAATASLMGLGVGFVLEGRDVRFLVKGSLFKKIIRFVVGLTITVAFLYGLQALIAGFVTIESNLNLYLVFSFIHNFVIAIVPVYFVPMFFTRIGLMEAEPEPQITASLNRVVPPKSDPDSSIGSGGF